VLPGGIAGGNAGGIAGGVVGGAVGGVAGPGAGSLPPQPTIASAEKIPLAIRDEKETFAFDMSHPAATPMPDDGKFSHLVSDYGMQRSR
jgi:outer membrane lipoprotein SlyB